MSDAPPAEPPRRPGFVRRAAAGAWHVPAGFGMLLRESEYVGDFSVEQVWSLAEDGLGDDEHGYRRGFLELVRAYRRLSVGTDRDGAGM